MFGLVFEINIWIWVVVNPRLRIGVLYANIQKDPAMKKKFSFVSLLLLMALPLLFGSCSSYSLIFSEEYPGADLSSYRTYRIVTPQEGTLPPGMTMVTYYNIAAAIREQMAERGFTEDPSSDMLVNIGLTVRKELVNTPYTTYVQTPGAPLPPPPAPYNGMVPYFMYPRGYYWPNYTAVTQWVPTLYREGVLTIDLVNMAEKKPLYTASVATILDNGNSQLRSLKGIAEAVQVLFSKFPVPLLPQYKK